MGGKELLPSCPSDDRDSFSPDKRVSSLMVMKITLNVYTRTCASVESRARAFNAAPSQTTQTLTGVRSECAVYRRRMHALLCSAHEP